MYVCVRQEEQVNSFDVRSLKNVIIKTMHQADKVAFIFLAVSLFFWSSKLPEIQSVTTDPTVHRSPSTICPIAHQPTEPNQTKQNNQQNKTTNKTKNSAVPVGLAGVFEEIGQTAYGREFGQLRHQPVVV